VTLEGADAVRPLLKAGLDRELKILTGGLEADALVRDAQRVEPRLDCASS
jgi:hypothetical protein